MVVHCYLWSKLQSIIVIVSEWEDLAIMPQQMQWYILVIAETGEYLSIWGKLKCADQYTGARWIMGYK